MAKQFIRKTKGPVIVKAANSNTISDIYRDSITIAYQYIGSKPASTTFDFFGKSFDTPIMSGPISMHGNGPETGDLGYAMDIDHGLDAYGEEDAQLEQFAPKTVDELNRISEASKLPFFIKGTLSVHDALLAVEAGVSGIVVSGHNNRFPCAVPPLKILPSIRQAVGDKLMILVDGGMNSGYDVFKALALGADGVLNARNLCATYMKEEEEGLTYRILEMTAELKGAMSNTGSPDLKHINTDSIILP